MSEAQAAEGFAAVVEDAGPLDLAELLGEAPVERKEAVQDRSK